MGIFEKEINILESFGVLKKKMHGSKWGDPMQKIFKHNGYVQFVCWFLEINQKDGE